MAVIVNSLWQPPTCAMAATAATLLTSACAFRDKPFWRVASACSATSPCVLSSPCGLMTRMFSHAGTVQRSVA